MRVAVAARRIRQFAPWLAGATVALAACAAVSAGTVRGPRPDAAAIEADVRYLASDALDGRRSGTPGNTAAADWIADRLSALRLERILFDSASCDPTGSCGLSYNEPFVARPSPTGVDPAATALPTRNIVGVIPGTDPVLRHQYVIVGAHFDHLGRSTRGALDPDRGSEIRNGADDNASGTAAVLELARLMARRPARRSVVVVLFSAEELGMLGSRYFVANAPVPLDSVQAMINLDMVGRLRADRLVVYGTGTAGEWPGVIDAANVTAALRLATFGEGYGPSDHSSFHARSVPVLHLTTDVHDDYHRVSDDADFVSFGGVARVVTFAERLTRDIADRPGRLTFVPMVTAAPGTPPR